MPLPANLFRGYGEPVPVACSANRDQVRDGPVSNRHTANDCIVQRIASGGDRWELCHFDTVRGDRTVKESSATNVQHTVQQFSWTRRNKWPDRDHENRGTRFALYVGDHNRGEQNTKPGFHDITVSQ